MLQIELLRLLSSFTVALIIVEFTNLKNLKMVCFTIEIEVKLLKLVSFRTIQQVMLLVRRVQTVHLFMLLAGLRMVHLLLLLARFRTVHLVLLLFMLQIIQNLVNLFMQDFNQINYHHLTRFTHRIGFVDFIKHQINFSIITIINLQLMFLFVMFTIPVRIKGFRLEISFIVDLPIIDQTFFK